MKILLVSATAFETAPFLEGYGSAPNNPGIDLKRVESGIGVLSSTYLILKAIQEFRPHFVIQAGIAGSFTEKYPPGSLVVAKQDILADLCVREPDGYRDMKQIGLESTGLLENPLNPAKLPGLPFVNAVTVNEVSTSPDRIDWFRNRFGAEIESMEGAALHFVARKENIPFLQLRAVSNFVGERNKQNWKMKEAISILNEELGRLVPKINEIWN